MPNTYSYPGIYVEEIPSGVRTIAGVSTSDTAFVDFFPRGPVLDPQRITSFGDFERVFGGLDDRSEASYALQQFYKNGGQISWVVRVDSADAVAASIVLEAGSPGEDTLRLEAANPGDWGNHLDVGVDHLTADPTSQFNLVIREVQLVNGRETVVNSETHRNLSMDPDNSRFVVSVLENDSLLVRATVLELEDVVDTRPNPTDDDVTAPSVVGNVDASGFLDFDDGAVDGGPPDDQELIDGIHALDNIAPFIFNILCLPATANLGDADASAVLTDAEVYCLDKRAFLIVDIPESITTPDEMAEWVNEGPGVGLRNRNAAVYFPRLEIPDALKENRPRNVGASGTLAGVFARTDATRGTWKAPAGTDATLIGASLAMRMNDLQNGALNPFGVNALRTFSGFGAVSWGARTLFGDDARASEWKYIPVRRLALFIEESLFQGLKWVVFEPNDAPLWAQIRMNVGAFMQSLFRQGAFQGTSPREAYLVKCDAETTTQNDIDRGIVNILVGFAPLKPAEFVVIKIQQLAGQTQS